MDDLPLRFFQKPATQARVARLKTSVVKTIGAARWLAVFFWLFSGGVGNAPAALVGETIGGVVAAGPTLKDFGFGRKKVPTSNRPLLVILIEYDGKPTLGHQPNEYDEIIFNPLRPPSINGYFTEVSNGRFHWSRAGRGIIGPIRLSAADAGLPHERRMATVIDAAGKNGYNFDFLDKNSDGFVTTEELGVLVIENIPNAATRATAPSCFKPTGSQVSLCLALNINRQWYLGVSFVGDRPQMMTIAHELSHQLGAIEMYGQWNFNSLHTNCTVMAGISGGADDRQTYHLDPWHKLQLGWSEPRIHALNSAGSATINAANSVRPDAPLILYDPQRGAREFFILEYRTQFSPGTNYDKNVCDSGLAIWHVVQDENKDPRTMPNVRQGGNPITAVYLEGRPTLIRTGATFWKSGDLTPNLLWLDGTRLDARLRVLPYDARATQINVEIISAAPQAPEFQTTEPCMPMFFTAAKNFSGSSLQGIWGDIGSTSRDRITIRLGLMTGGSRGFSAQALERINIAGMRRSDITAKAEGLYFSRINSWGYDKAIYYLPPADRPPPAISKSPVGGQGGVLQKQAPSSGLVLGGRTAASGSRATAPAKAGGIIGNQINVYALVLPNNVSLQVFIQCDENIQPTVHRLRYLRKGSDGSTLTDVMLGRSQDPPR